MVSFTISAISIKPTACILRPSYSSAASLRLGFVFALDFRAVLLPPYHPRMNRPHLDEHGNRVLAKPREAFKVEFDERVFGTRYF